MIMMCTYLIRHSEAPVVSCRPPHVRDKRYIEEVHQVQPAIQDKPSALPVVRYEIFIALSGEDPAVNKEKDEDDDDADEDAVPEFPVHCSFDGLLALHEVFGSEVEGVESPDVKSC